MKKILFLLLLLLASLSYSQTLSITPVYHYGTYTFLGDKPVLIEGNMEPTFDWEVSLYVPLTEEFAITPSVYYYNAIYTEPDLPEIDFNEHYWYISLTFEYTFSSEPLFNNKRKEPR